MRNHPVILAWILGTSLLHAHAQGTCPATHPSEFKIELKRLGVDEVMDNGVKVPRVYGDIGVNGQNFGRFYENPALKIAAGVYRGTLRYESNHNFVQGSCGEIGRQGDFLLEVSGVKAADGAKRTDILFHPGFKPSHSKGCVLFGARQRDAAGNPKPLSPDEPLVKLRRAFYGTDTPNQCPNKVITITVTG
ncbi:MAG TPA: hypothetical protein VF522_15305 [Ramlibacter sp.]|uniref:hypothetical protein n=1 Tax=Ramlibacter sp. TaxID=1917967 RepID=UPI002ED556FB